MKYLCLWRNAKGEPQTDAYEASVTPAEKSILRITKDDENYSLKVIRWIFTGAPAPELRCVRIYEDDGNYWP